MVAFELCTYIPKDIDVETLMDIESSILKCSAAKPLLTVDDVMDVWYQLITSKSTQFEKFVEYEYFISNYIGELPSDMRSVIISCLETFGVSIIDWETNTVLNSPQFSFTKDIINIDGDDYEYTVPPGGDFIEHNSQRPSIPYREW